MRAGLLAALALSLAAGQAQALKCVEPDALGSFRRAMDSADTYSLLRGSFDFLPGLLPGDVTTRDDPSLPQPAPFSADFTGQALEPDGFTRDVAMPVMIQSVCLGPWCGQIGVGQDVMVFAHSDTEGRLVVEVDPCGTWVFPDPDEALLEQMRACTADPESCAG